MKKSVIIAGLALCTTLGAMAQGTVTFNNRVTGSVVTHVYGPNAGNSSLARVGNGTGDTNPGATDYTGFTLLAGSQYVSQLLGASLGTAESSLIPQAPTTTFRTGAAAGFIAGVTATIAGVAPDTGRATVEMVAWDNTSGLYPTWTLASSAWLQGTIAAGKSGTLDTATLGGTSTPPNLVGLQSFNIYMVPEPTSLALAGLGAAALVIFRRRNK